MKKARVLVINPNSNASVTRGLAEALQPFDLHPGIRIDCQTIVDGPFGIESDADIEAVVPLIVDHVRSNADYDAYVIACYSDPGLVECRAITGKPVFGIQQSALATSVARGARFGVLALGEKSIARHLKYIRKLKLEHLLAGERSLDLSVDEAANGSSTMAKIIEAGRRLVDERSAEVLILGCAGMAVHRSVAQQRLGVPVIDPTQAAVALAVGALL
ncbi:MAG: aspartate/glutamate racemase family protein [Gammaproteobacteria bacterium]|nr:aspartate/glutamate racemase family protein [Gammaproteobacteria bacterium]MDH4315933.1 aspartate/glutamate racemase family protein [Gammaproteobacteria bacterium]MDH5215242.1 aspartate/glutamate racemase family protein [Gammaproteobacteria bacterium]